MNDYFKNIYSKRLVISIGVFYIFYVTVLAVLYINQNNIADFLIARGNDFGSYNEVMIINMILGIVMNSAMFMFYIVGVWITLSIKNMIGKLILLVIPIIMASFIIKETITLYSNDAFYSDNVFWLEFSVRAILYFFMLAVIGVINRIGINSN
ncbi:MAG: hypothetical protein ACVCEJ_02950 [Candidatus Izemoplasmataceae bacterium]